MPLKQAHWREGKGLCSVFSITAGTLNSIFCGQAASQVVLRPGFHPTKVKAWGNPCRNLAGRGQSTQEKEKQSSPAWNRPSFLVVML